MPVTVSAGPADLEGFAGRVTSRIDDLARGLETSLRAPVRELAGRPGKFLRPMLLRACAGFGEADPARVVRLGAVIELVHLASLMHDDMVDRAVTRRGAPAAHTVVGAERAMLAGLGCFALAGMEAADLGEGVSVLVGRTVAGLSYGQLLDVERAFDTRLAPADYLELVQRKTGSLFRLTCGLGAMEAAAGPDAIGALGAFGHDLGVAFQVLDDCLDLAAWDSGKPSGTDHLLGLFGAPTLYALAEDDSGELRSLLLSPSFGESDLPKVRTLVTAHGGLAAAAALAREWYDSALSALDGLPGRAACDALIEVAAATWGGAS